MVTGGAGFIGSALVRHLISDTENEILNIDKLTYSGSLLSLSGVEHSKRYQFIKADIADKGKIQDALNRFQPDTIMHLAAESHVDRSIDGPEDFIQTNIVGTFRLLESARQYFQGLNEEKRTKFRFLHISTDEVFGSLGRTGFFSESTSYDPRSPYSASKAASDHLVRAWNHTYKLPILITNCSNNYGPYQFPEKLIPVVILNALHEKQIPVYGQGLNIRDWLFVDDHVHALMRVVSQGKVGETYLISGRNEKTNIELVKLICSHLDRLKPRSHGKKYSDLITFVQDRPGHDLRYAVDSTKIQKELGWSPKFSFEEGIHATVEWYLKNQEWCDAVSSKQYEQRLGLKQVLSSEAR